MKEKKGIAGLFLAGVLLANGTAVSAAEVKNLEVNRMPSGDMAEYTPSKPMELLSGQDAAELDAIMQAYNAGGSSLNKNASGSYYYYENLDPVAKEIYDVMLGVAQDPVSEGNIGLMMTDIDPTGQDYYYEFNVAYRALCFDHPELFWLYAGQEAEMVYLSEAVNYGGFYFVYIKMAEPFTNYETQMNAFNAAAASFLADINQDASDYEIVRQIHDKLIDLVNYNDPVGDGEVEEGECWEAFMFAAHYGLSNLCVVLDRNHLQIDGTTETVMNSAPLEEKLKAFNFNVLTINGHDLDAIESAIAAFRAENEKPTCIILDTLKGKGVSFMENSVDWHGKGPNDEEYAQAMQELNAAYAALEEEDK